jgi:hypothetical protein
MTKIKKSADEDLLGHHPARFGSGLKAIEAVARPLT